VKTSDMTNSLKELAQTEAREWTLWFDNVDEIGGIYTGKPSQYEKQDHVDLVHVTEASHAKRLSEALLLAVRVIEMQALHLEHIKKHMEMGTNKPEMSLVWTIATRALAKADEMLSNIDKLFGKE